MRFSKWDPIYQQILKDFGFSREEDERARDLLDGLLAGKDLIDEGVLKDIITKKRVFVVGNGPSIHENMKKEEFDGPLITADGATSVVLKYGYRPSLIVTDLDGNVEDQVRMNREGVPVLVHAHGDNQDALREWVPKFEGPVMGTCQCEPRGEIRNFGGFTDGDRCVFVADHFKAMLVTLVGFDFKEDEDAEFRKLDKVKLRKLDWAFVLIGFFETTPIQFLGEHLKESGLY